MFTSILLAVTLSVSPTVAPAATTVGAQTQIAAEQIFQLPDFMPGPQRANDVCENDFVIAVCMDACDLLGTPNSTCFRDCCERFGEPE